jgi:hypothetical protein
METRNVYLYWTGKEYSLISLLRKIIYLHSTNKKGYKVNLIKHNNITKYIKYIPNYFNKLCPAHQADFVRVNVICDYGGIWLDSDTLVIDSLDSLFDLVENKNGFFITENNTILWNGIFGSKPNTPLMIEWKKKMINLLNKTQGVIGWTDIGNEMLQNMKNKDSSLYDNYHIFNGLDNLYPVNFDKCEEEYVCKPYDNYKNIIREYQPLTVLVNSVYKKLQNKTELEILNCDMPLNYFINKSFENMNTSKNKVIFENIYSKKIWNNGDPSIPLSGPGSSLENSSNCSNLLNEFIYKNNCLSILDLGCGDLTWISKTTFFNDTNITYTGIDIVENILESHSIKHPNHTFICKDLVNFKDINFSSIIVIRDVIFHLKNTEILTIFENIKNKFNFILITSCNNRVNTDIFDKWNFSEKNLHIAPFNKSYNFITRVNETVFNRSVYIYSHDVFYNL